MEIKEILEAFDKFIGCPECGVKEGQAETEDGFCDINESKDETAEEFCDADIEKAEYDEIKPEKVDVETLAKNLLNKFDTVEKKYQGKDAEKADMEQAEYTEIKPEKVEVEKAPKLESEESIPEVITEDFDPLTKSEEFRYQLLDRMRSDCEYYINMGGDHLWAGNIEDQIKIMKDLYNSFEEKPEWLSLEQIEEFEKKMLDVKAQKEAGTFKDMFGEASESMNEISLELADHVNTLKQIDAVKKSAEYVKDKTEINREIAKEANAAAKKSNKLFAKWKKSKGIQESEVVAKFQEEDKIHEIVRTKEGLYHNRYNVVEGKAKTTTAGVKKLPTALAAMKRKNPNAEEVK